MIDDSTNRKIYDAVSAIIGDGRRFLVVIPEPDGLTIFNGNCNDSFYRELLKDAFVASTGKADEKSECPPI